MNSGSGSLHLASLRNKVPGVLRWTLRASPTYTSTRASKVSSKPVPGSNPRRASPAFLGGIGSRRSRSKVWRFFFLIWWYRRLDLAGLDGDSMRGRLAMQRSLAAPAVSAKQNKQAPTKAETILIFQLLFGFLISRSWIVWNSSEPRKLVSKGSGRSVPGRAASVDPTRTRSLLSNNSFEHKAMIDFIFCLVSTPVPSKAHKTSLNF